MLLIQDFSICVVTTVFLPGTLPCTVLRCVNSLLLEILSINNVIVLIVIFWFIFIFQNTQNRITTIQRIRANCHFYLRTDLCWSHIPPNGVFPCTIPRAFIFSSSKWNTTSNNNRGFSPLCSKISSNSQSQNRC